MNNSIYKSLIDCVTSLLLIFVVATPAIADEPISACQSRGATFGFFNGVLTTPVEADASLEEFIFMNGKKMENGEPIRYEVMYNQTEGFDDFVETFEQRLSEHGDLLNGRFELFFEAIRGHGPWLDKIMSSVSSTGQLFEAFVDWHKAQSIAILTSMLGNSSSQVNSVEHRTRIDNWILEGKKILLVAHSQGNLFANAAYNHALTKANKESIGIVHIAPASPIINGPHTLADLDLVINGLRIFGEVPPITDDIPGYLLRPAGANKKKDKLGHGLSEIYLNKGLSISSKVKSQIKSVLKGLVTPSAQAMPGFFTATLTWNGVGDVDLHTYEPNGSHVFYASPTGSTGYLDVDNTNANGPEHYFASCDIDKLQEGNYSISVANFRGATQKTATVQVSSWKDGVLGTKSVVLGQPTGSVPSQKMFDVNVKFDESTESYQVTVE
ncbi:hypothetical protein OQ486_16285 [Plesiomonas shigelloides]|uniref:hypothetical protein n=1 Tax=Plesiomonas shigelloides TaxID=703 RepID=UPI002245C4EE|nr:hypothetical protein [Plesiomonas shigelloides]MCX2535003.1 hypothetical protein [Plesiomonas shigelloides]